MPKSSCLNELLWSRESFEESMISDCKSPINFQIKENKLFKSVLKKEIGLLWSRESFEESIISDLESPSNFKAKEKKFIEIGTEITKLC